MLVVSLTAALPTWSQESKQDKDEKAAVVNGSTITKSIFDAELLRVERAHLGLGRPLTIANVATYNHEVLEALIRQEILFQESHKSRVKTDKADIDKQIDALKKQFLSETEYRNELARQKVTEDLLRIRLERDLVLQKYIEQQFSDKVKVTDIDMMTYYESHLELLKQPALVRVSHILIQTDPKWEKARIQEAKQKIESIQNKLKKGQDFAALAREHSDGTARTNGGDMGYVRAGQLGNQFEKAVFALKPGTVSDIIKADNGFHLFKVTDKKVETILSYDSVKERIRQALLQEKIKQAADLYGKKLRETAKVEIFVKEGIPANKP
jgi:parvulin-like peptidyl-prolyl isomerase